MRFYCVIILQAFLNQGLGLRSAVIEGFGLADRINGCKLRSKHCFAFDQCLQEACTMSMHEGCSCLQLIGLRIRDGAQVEEVARLCAVASMPHFLGDDLR